MFIHAADCWSFRSQPPVEDASPMTGILTGGSQQEVKVSMDRQEISAA
jgi:hypothetical protein